MEPMETIVLNNFGVFVFEVFVFEVLAFEVFVFEVFVFEVLGFRFWGLSFPNTRQRIWKSPYLTICSQLTQDIFGGLKKTSGAASGHAGHAQHD